RLFAHREMSGYETAVAPTHDPDAIGVDVRERLEVVDAGQHVIQLLAAVVDRVVEGGAVPGAATIVGRHDDVATLDRFLHEWQHRLRPIAVHAAVHPHHRRVKIGRAHV